MFTEFKRRFWLPPRAHGEIIEDRTVSFLELFYDLVYVVVIGRAAHHLAGHVSWQGVFEFAVIFGLIWIAWMSGTLYYELHGREDGRTRVFVFIQMLLLALLAVYTEDAAGSDGARFAIVYILFLAVIGWLFYRVRRVDPEEYLVATGRYLKGTAITIVTVGVTIFLPDETRMLVWAALVVVWILGGMAMARMPGMDTGMAVTDSLVERMGLFVIIVLGEVVVGVVTGLSEVERTPEVMVTGLVGLSIGFAYWWTYFDFVGRRFPVPDPSARGRWLFAHLPVTMAIAAAGAAMVSLIEHGDEASTPSATAWLLTGSVILGLMSLIVAMRTLEDLWREPEIFLPVTAAMLGAGGIALLLGLLSPAPWVLAASLVVTLLLLWFYALSRWYRVQTTRESAG